LGALTPNELRTSIGKYPYPDDYAFANKPMQVSMAQMTLKQSEAVKKDWENEESYQKRMAKLQQQQQQQQPGQPGGMGGGGQEEGAGGMGGMGLDELFQGLGDGQGEADDQEMKALNSANGGDQPKSYGSIELMKAIEALPEDKRLLASIMLKALQD
jgi:hypothetical protein